MAQTYREGSVVYCISKGFVNCCMHFWKSKICFKLLPPSDIETSIQCASRNGKTRVFKGSSSKFRNQIPNRHWSWATVPSLPPVFSYVNKNVIYWRLNIQGAPLERLDHIRNWCWRHGEPLPDGFLTKKAGEGLGSLEERGGVLNPWHELGKAHS